MLLREQSAAQYVRMSTDMQKYSIENQSEAIALYAAVRGLTVVKTYEDAGRSGVSLHGRTALQALLADVSCGRTDYSTILVYDVSRWGRFQDSDESAHYEYLCRQAGVRVEYCAEQFVNDGSLTTAVLKNIKRAMAGEFSRELSVKVHAGQSRLTAKGFHLGAAAGFGLRRMLVDENKNHRFELKHGQRKSLHSEHVILVPGPLKELKTIERVYSMFLDDRCDVKSIVKSLNADGVRSGSGGAWRYDTVRDLLTNDKYVGSAVYNRTSKKLNGNWRRNPREEWVRCDGAFEAIVPKDRFEQAKQRMEAISRPLTKNDRLDMLTALWCQRGHLSGKIVDRARIAPSGHSYAHHFGSLARAFRMIGFKNRENLSHNADIRKMVVDEVEEGIVRLGGTFELSPMNKQFVINSEIRIAICVSRMRSSGPRIWQFGYRAETKPDIVLGARVLKRGGPIEDYFVLPFMFLPHGSWITTSESSQARLERFRTTTLKPFYELFTRTKARAPQW